MQTIWFANRSMWHNFVSVCNSALGDNRTMATFPTQTQTWPSFSKPWNKLSLLNEVPLYKTQNYITSRKKYVWRKYFRTLDLARIFVGQDAKDTGNKGQNRQMRLNGTKTPVHSKRLNRVRKQLSE